MHADKDTRRRAPRELAVQAMGVLGAAGGGLAVATALLPPPAEGSEASILIAGVVAGLIGAVLLLRRPTLSDPLLGVLTLVGTALVTISTHEGGVIGGAADNQMLYLWIVLYAFYFLSLRNALLQTAIVGGAYAWLLSTQEVTSNQATTQWLVTMTTLLVVGFVVARLRGNIYRMVEELSERAYKDPLTGLLNRSALKDRVAAERAQAVRDGIPLSVLAIDIDGFKELNDSLGHARGDEVLEEVAAALVLSTRSHDVVARIGGDEFAVLLPGATEAAGRAVAEGVRREVGRALRRENDGITVSVGVATGQNPMPSFEDLLRKADLAMYAGKRAGGNRVSAQTR